MKVNLAKNDFIYSPDALRRSITGVHFVSFECQISVLFFPLAKALARTWWQAKGVSVRANASDSACVRNNRSLCPQWPPPVSLQFRRTPGLTLLCICSMTEMLDICDEKVSMSKEYCDFCFPVILEP